MNALAPYRQHSTSLGRWSKASALGVVMLAMSGVGFSQAVAEDEAPIEVTGEVSVVVGSVDGELKSDANAVLEATTSTIFANGLELGANASLRADADMGIQRPAGGRYSSFLSGGSRGFGPEGADVFLEGAYLFARGGFGSLHVGRDEGVASRLSVTSPTIFRAVGVNDWQTDLTGLNDVHTINDFSGQSTKVSYMPPAGFLGGVIGQLQLGVSYAPELSACGEEACIPFSGLAIGNDGLVVSADQAWQNVVETALYYENDVDVGQLPLRFGVSASYVSAEDNGATLADLDAMVNPLFGDYQSYAMGLNLSYGSLTFGGSLKSTNAGLTEDRDEDYLAFDAGVTYEAGEWNFMVGYGAADAERDAALLVNTDDLSAFSPLGLNRQTQTAQAGVSYVFNHGVTLGAAAQFVDSDKSDALGGAENAAAIVFESSIKF